MKTILLKLKNIGHGMTSTRELIRITICILSQLQNFRLFLYIRMPIWKENNLEIYCELDTLMKLGEVNLKKIVLHLQP